MLASINQQSHRHWAHLSTSDTSLKDAVMSNQPTVTGIIPCYNAGRFVAAAIESLLSQTRPLDELIVIDDCSTDESASIIQTYQNEGRLSRIVNSVRRGRADSLNAVIPDLSTTYVVLLDADDLAHPDRVEKQISFMEACSRLGCSSSFVRYINKNNTVIGRGSLDLLNEYHLQTYLSSNEPFGLFCPATILRTNVFRDPALRFRRAFWPADDIDLWNRIAESGWLVWAQPEYLTDYRIHGGSAVTSNFHATRRKYEFLRACLKARRAGKNEPSEAEFLAMWHDVTLLQKLNRWRKIQAKCCYRTSGFLKGEGHLPAAIFNLACSFLLQPSYTVRRAISQISLGQN
jgi:glycosyltransferase involved in cell wall biosynthesis